MSYPKIDQILLPGDLGNYSIASEGTSDSRALTGLTTVNFFVGENNSGKSRLIRRMAANENPRVRATEYPVEINSVKQDILDVIDPGASEEISEIMELWDEIEFPSNGSNLANSLGQLQRVLELALVHSNDGRAVRIVISKIQELDASVRSDSFPRSIKALRANELLRLYIPVLRGLRPIPNSELDGQSDYFAFRTKEDYFDEKFTGEIYTGLRFYEDLRSLLLGDHDQRKTAKAFEDFLSIELFGGVSVTLIPRKNSDVVYFKLGEAEERKIHDVGDGLQQLIILTFPLFKNKDKSCHVYIEEPELFLHPGMQRALIKAMRRFDKNQYFIATHSNHFLDLSLEFDDISIYTLQRDRVQLEEGGVKEDEFVISLVSSQDFRVLEMLGARTSSVFLSNCTIWVEGITDRRYLGHFLKLYLEELRKKGDSDHFEPRQDLHYSFVEYSGGNITHWSFLDKIEDAILAERLCAKAMLVTDKDKGKEERHQQLKEKLKEDYFCLPCIEIENLLTPDVIKKILLSYGEDEAVISKIDYQDYEKKPLGLFLDLLLKKKRKRDAKYGVWKMKKNNKSGKMEPSGGTINQKLEFCSRAIKAMPVDGNDAFTFDMLSESARKLTEKTYRFISEKNGF